MNEANRTIEFAAERLMRQLHDFAVRLGVSEQIVRQIVDWVIKDMPRRPDEDRLDEARKRMISVP